MASVSLMFCFFIIVSISFAVSNPVNNLENDTPKHVINKRFINPSLTSGDFDDTGLYKLRTKRSYSEECEKFQLCKLHARSSRNFMAAFELYFVNKENARLWDHQSRNAAECDRKFPRCS